MALTGAPFDGPIGAAKVGYKNGQYILNPSTTELVDSELELVVAGTKSAVLMVESEAKELSEEVMLGAVMFGHQQMQIAIDTINELVAEAGKPKWNWQAPAKNDAMIGAIKAAVGDRLGVAFQVRDKLERKDAISALKKDAMASLAAQIEANGWNAAEASKEFAELEYQTLRDSVLSTKIRIAAIALLAFGALGLGLLGADAAGLGGNVLPTPTSTPTATAISTANAIVRRACRGK